MSQGATRIGSDDVESSPKHLDAQDIAHHVQRSSSAARTATSERRRLSNDDHDYHIARARTALEMAARSTLPTVAEVHLQMHRLYLQLAQSGH